jgi:hypothetical protein
MKRFLTTPIITAALFLLGAGVTLGTIYIGGSGGSGEINLQKGLVGHWNFNGNANDSTPYGNNGTVSGATLTSDRKSQTDQAYSFDGENDYINCGTDSSLKPASSLSIEVWVKMETPTTSREPSIAGNSRYSGTGVSGYSLSVTPTGTWTGESYWVGSWSNITSYSVGFYLHRGVVQGDSNWRGSVNYSVSVEDIENKWNHIVAIFDRPAMKLYLNGEEVNSSTYDYDIYYHELSTYIGATNWALSSQEFSGSIDEVRIYNRALNEEEIRTLYESYGPALQVADTQKNLAGYWKFDGNAKDATPYGNDGALVGPPDPAEDRKGQAGHAYNFNGTSDYVNVGNNKFQYQDNFTVSAYFKFPSLPDNAGICSARHPIIYNHDYGYNLLVGSTGKVVWNVYDTAGSSKAVSSASSVVGESFVHAVGIKSGTTISLYVNGAFVGQDTLANNSVYYMDYPFVIGGYAVCGGQRFYATGIIDDVRVYSQALDEEEVRALYNSYDSVAQVSDLQKGLVGHWEFNGNAKDATPYGNDGTVSGAVLAADRKGQSNKAYSFNGESDYWIVDYGSGSKPEELKLDQFTVSAWIKANSFPSNSVYIATDREGCGRHNYLLSLGNGYPQIQFIEDESSPHQWRSATASQQIATGSWYHLAGSYNGQNLIIYVNGAEKGNTEIVSTPEDDNNSASFKVGYSNCIHSSITNYFNGYIDDVRVYSRALSADEIQTLYESY